jgi:hypothetical protein
MKRREFCAITSVAALGSLLGSQAHADTAAEERSLDSLQLQTGNGEWTYHVVSNWGPLPEGKAFGGTHGGIATDKARNLYISTQSATGVLVYDRDGKLLKTIANEYPEVHSLVYANENDQEYFYATVQKGTPKENWLFVKMKTDGTVVQKITAPPEAGFHAPNEWRLTAAVPGPDGSDMETHASSSSTRAAIIRRLIQGREPRMACAIAAMGWLWTCVTGSRSCWFATGKTGVSATMISMASLSAM